ncbi:MAG: S9 family peptidase [Alphaproteobacteria bacterium]|nr:S9 family peptidase [Alphaproteobacteria bacterium]
MKRISAAAVALVCALFTGIAVAAPSPEAFGSLPNVETVRISPSGKYLAIIHNTPGASSVRTFDATTLQSIGGIAAAKQQVIRNIIWYSDDRLLLSIGEVVKFSESIVNEDEIKGTNLCRIMSIPRDAKNPIQLKTAGILRDATFSCDILSTRGPKPNTILLQASVVGGSGLNSKSQFRVDTKVHAVDIMTGEGEVLGEVGTRSTAGWDADANGNVRLRYDVVAGEIVTYARLDGSSSWDQVHRQPAAAFEAVKETGQASSIMQIAGFAADPNQVYAFFWPGDRMALGLFDLRTRQITPVVTDPKYDVTGVVGLGRKIVGASVSRVMTDQVFFSDDWRQLQSRVAANFAGHHVSIVSISDDRNKMVIYAEGPKWPGGAYLLFDLTGNQLTMVSARYPTIDLASTGEQKYITYAARDGMQIDAYLTVPRTGGKNLPAIILPHGGPQARDDGGFDWLSQFFASRGYVVLQPQYRGSDGFGLKFALAGRKQWGLKMQDDLSDGVKYLTSSGIADPAKVCIMGWSYGGYAAMAGATLTPELYKCAIAGAGVSDLEDMLIWSGKYGGGSLRYWRLHIGDPNADKSAIVRASPAKHAAKVTGPMLLIHGELDNVVPIRQSQIMADALKAAGKPYEFVRLADENHNITFASTRIKTLQAMDAFLAKYNPAR